MAYSAVLFGYGSGAILFDIIQTLYINPENHSPDKSYSLLFPEEKYFSRAHNLDMLERVPNAFLYLAMLCFTLQLVGYALIFDYEPNVSSPDELTGLLNNSSTNGDISGDTSVLSAEQRRVEEESETNSLGIRYLMPSEGMELKDALKSRTFYVILTMLTLAMVAPRTVITNYKVFGQTFISSDLYLAGVGSFTNIFNGLGRLFWCFMANRYPFKFCMIVALTIVIATVSTFYLTKLMLIKELYVLSICSLFFSQCGIFVCMPSILNKTFGAKNFTGIYGFMLVSSALSSTTLAVIGSFKDEFGWFGLFTIGSCLTLIAWIMAFFFNIKKRNGDDI